MVYRNLLPLFQMGVYDRFNADSSYFQYRVQEQLFAKKCAEEAICLLKNEDDILPVGLNQKILLTGGVEPFSGTGSGFVEGYKHTSFAEGLEKVYNRFTYQKNPSDNLIKDADVVFYNLNIEGGEGYDVAFIDSSGVNKQIFHLLELNKNVVILINACNGFPMPWKNEVKGILYNFFLGQERGNALANIISGKVNPSGRLPFTIEEAFKDSPDPDFNYLGGKPFWYGDNSYYKEYWKGNDIKTEVEIAKYIKPHQFVHIPYNEGVFIGYRWYQKYNKPYHFAFGYGLSYTQFKFDKPILNTHVIYQNDSISLSLNVKNTGKSAGSEVVQLYIGDEESTVERPVKELKAFQKVYLEPGESKKVNFIILGKDLAFWDIISHKWKIEEGKFTIYIGKSSDDNKMKETIEYINPFSG
jgi:beta-glucosidase